MGRISALTELTSLASDDYLVVLDSSANIAKKISVANAFGIPDASWTSSGESWTYATSTTITVPTDATTKYSAGMVVKFTQSTGGTKYAVITTVAATVLTLFMLGGATLVNEAITSTQYTSLASPLGAGLINGKRLDFSFTGEGGIWWEEIARGNASGGALTISNIPARKYIMLLIRTVGTGGTISHRLRFNSDTGANYASRYELDGGADSSSVSDTSDIYGTTVTDAGSTGVITIVNESSREKTYVSHFTQNPTAGAANQVNKIIASGKWTNTSSQISSITLYNTGAGTYATTTEVVVLGHN